jgi:hypothetical protein
LKFKHEIERLVDDLLERTGPISPSGGATPALAFPSSRPRSPSIGARRMSCIQVMPTNPAAAVCGPEHVVKTGRTPVLEAANGATARLDRGDDLARSARRGVDRHPEL